MKRPHILSRLRLLVVDDCPDSVESLRLLGQLWGHQVRTATDGVTALEVAREFQPHVVLLDIGMPRMDGYQVARQLRELPGAERIFVLACTGFGRDQDRDAAYQAGFDLHLTKPIDPEILQDFLSKVSAGNSSCYGRLV